MHKNLLKKDYFLLKILLKNVIIKIPSKFKTKTKTKGEVIS